MMKTFKDVNLSGIPAPVADLLRCLIPEDADVEITYGATKVPHSPDISPLLMSLAFDLLAGLTGAGEIPDTVKDDCTPMGCADCSDCPISKTEAVNLLEPMNIISVAFTKLASLVRVNGNIAPEERNYAIDALSDISEAVDYALEVLEGGN